MDWLLPGIKPSQAIIFQPDWKFSPVGFLRRFGLTRSIHFAQFGLDMVFEGNYGNVWTYLLEPVFIVLIPNE